jgi:hypothetical protein
MFNELHIWVEGDNDRRFFENIIAPMFKNSFNKVDIIQYRQMKKQYVNAIIKKIKGKNEYIFTKDMDFPACMTLKKDSIIKSYSNIDINKIVIVIMDIEAWYLAGLDRENCDKLKVKYFVTTDGMTKTEFDHIKPKEFTSDIDFRMEIMKRYDLDVAKLKNKSFKYFLDKYEGLITYPVNEEE